MSRHGSNGRSHPAIVQRATHTGTAAARKPGGYFARHTTAKKAAIGAGIGAAGGGILGYLHGGLKGGLEGAMGGGVVGAVAGTALGLFGGASSAPSPQAAAHGAHGIYPHRRRHGIINKRGRKTIAKAIRYYGQLNKAMRGIEKMAGKHHVRRHGGGYRRNSFRGRPARY